MSEEKLHSTLKELFAFLERIDNFSQRERLAAQVDRAVEPILRAAQGQRGPMTFPPQNQPSSQSQPGSSGGSSQHSLTPQPAVTQTTGTVECPRCNQILNIDVTLS